MQRSEIVFVDATLPDAQSLVADLQAQRNAGRPIEIVSIGPGQDGLALIGAVLAGRHDIAAVHVLAHGSDGQLQLGSTTLDDQTLMRRAGEVAGWSTALTADADLLLYGCDLAQTALGQRLVQDLAALTGADVAASTDLTGAAERGGNWTFEYQTGHIEAALAPSAWEQAHWQGVMATYTVNTTLDVTGTSLLPGSLRWAISQANANPGTDTIAFAVNGTFNMAPLVSGDDSNVSGDFDVKDSVNIVGNGTGNTIINGNGADRVFDLRSGTINISGLTIQGGRSNAGAGLRVGPSPTVTLTDVVVQDNLGSGNSRGAGIYVDGSLTLRNVVVQNNGDAVSGNADGAGIYIDNNASLDARNVEIRNNIAGSGKNGGGLYVADNATATLEDVTVAGNQAQHGGGIWSHGSSTSLVNATVSGNAATSQGGGIWTDEAVTLDHVTLADNSASTGGGVFVLGGSVRAKNSLFAANTGGNTNQALTSQGYNLSDDASAGFGGTGDQKNVAADLLALADNGGYTRTQAIGAGSAARDAANPVTALNADQRGTAYSGGRADIGAYEYNLSGSAPTVSGVSDQSIVEDGALAPLTFTIGDFETGAGSLIVTATSSNQALVPDANLLLGGSGSNRTISLTPAPNANSSVNGGPATITVSVSDGGNTSTVTFDVTVLAVNDAPAFTLPAAATTNEDTTLTLSGASAPRVDDVDAAGAPLQVTLAVTNGLLSLSGTTGLSFVTGTGTGNASMTFSGSQSAINAALDGLRYTPGVNYSGGSQLDLSVNDLGNTGSGGARTASGSLAINVTAVNDAPLLGLPGSQVTTLPSALTYSAANGNAITLSDVDAGAAPIELTLTTAGVGNGTLSFGSTTGLTLVSGTGSGDTAVVLRGSQADLDAALATLSFNASANGTARIDVSANDLGNSGSGGALTTSGAVTISVSNDFAPVLTLSRTSVSFNENDTAVALDPALTLNDSDNASLASASVRIGSGYAGPEDVLSFTGVPATMGNISGSYSAGVLSLVSAGQTATLTQWQAALQSITYVNTSDAPSGSARAVTLTVNDGIADGAARTLVVTVMPLNDAPILVGANNLAPIAEDQSGNPGTLVSTLVAGQVSDIDAAAQAGIAVTGVDNSNGNWQYSTDGGSTWNAFGAVSDTSARLLGADAGTAVRFVPDTDWNGSVGAGLTFRAWDRSSGSAGSSADASLNGGTTAFSVTSASSGITVTPLNDAPILADPIANQSATQDAFFSFALPAGSFADIDAGDTLSYAATLSSSAPLPAWLGFDTATRTFSGTPGNANVGAIAIRVTATDGASASAFGDFTLTVANVNGAPLLVNPIADQTAVAGAPVQFVLPRATFMDPDAGDTLTYAATLADGSALPKWLAFDARSVTFTSAPAIGDAGNIVVRVTATDSAGAAAQGLFAITVSVPTPTPTTTPIATPTATPTATPIPTPSPPVVEAAAPEPIERPAAIAPAVDAPVPAKTPPATAPVPPPSVAPVALPAVATVPGAQFTSAAPAPEAARRSGATDPSESTRPSVRTEVVLANAPVPQFTEMSMTPLLQLLHSDEITRKFEELQRQIFEQGGERQTTMASSVALTGGLSIGYVVWLVRGGVLVSSMLSALPAWQMLDPLPVLAASRARKDCGNDPQTDDPEVERLFDEPSETRHPGAPSRASAAASNGKPDSCDTRR
ncbi:MAG TPA: DUF4347 domain-containing protein [Caldimonas sp.]